MSLLSPRKIALNFDPVMSFIHRTDLAELVAPCCKVSAQSEHAVCPHVPPKCRTKLVLHWNICISPCPCVWAGSVDGNYTFSTENKNLTCKILLNHPVSIAKHKWKHFPGLPYLHLLHTPLISAITKTVSHQELWFPSLEMPNLHPPILWSMQVRKMQRKNITWWYNYSIWSPYAPGS